MELLVWTGGVTGHLAVVHSSPKENVENYFFSLGSGSVKIIHLNKLNQNKTLRKDVKDETTIVLEKNTLRSLPSTTIM